MKVSKKYSPFKRLLSFVLCSIMILQIIPIAIFANVLYEHYITKQSMAFNENPSYNSIEPIIINYDSGFYEEYQYNGLEKVERIWYNFTDGSRVNAYDYDYYEDGSLKKFTNNICGETIEFSYGTSGRLTSSSGRKISNSFYKNDYVVEYDDLERVISKTNTIDYLASSVNCNTNSKTTYNYNSDGSLQQEQIYHGEDCLITSEYSYDDFVRPTQIYSSSGDFSHTTTYIYSTEEDDTEGVVASYKSNVNGTLITYTYGYDSNGNLTNISGGGNTVEYTYDDLGQLISETKGLVTKTYTYDSSGNIVSIAETKPSEDTDPGFEPIIHWALNRPYTTDTTVFEYENLQNAYLLTSYDGQAITYDEVGNPLSYYNGASYSFTWQGSRLTEATKDSKIMSFEYNDEGVRTKKTVNGVDTVYYLNCDQIIAEKTDARTVIYIYDVTNTPIGMKYRENSYAEGEFDLFWFEKNLQGDIIAIYDESGNKLVTYNYDDAWGNHTVSYSNSGASTGAAYNRFRYRGYYYDTDLGMYYLQSRYYDANICRFISPKSSSDSDQVTLENNTYAYCINSPVIYVSDFGVALASISGLPWPGAIHRELQEILEGQGYILEVGVGGGIGRIDLLWEENSYIYEIKPNSASLKRAKAQLQRYVDLSEGKYVIGEARPELTGYFDSQYGYAVDFYYVESGIVLYERHRKPVELLSFSPHYSIQKTSNEEAKLTLGIVAVGLMACIAYTNWEIIFNKSGLKEGT